MNKKTILVLANASAIHGAGFMNSILLNSKFTKEFNVIHIPYIFAKSQSDLGKIRIGKLINFIKIFIKSIKVLISENIDALYRPISPKGIAFLRDSIILIFIDFLNVPYILHLHGKGIKEEYNKSSSLKKYIYRRVFGRAIGVIHLGRFLLKDIEDLVPKENMYVVPDGIPDLSDRFDDKRSNGGAKRVLFLSNMKKDKGPLVLLETLPQVKKRIPNVKYIFVGGWSNDNCKEEFFELINKNNLSHDVEYKGRVNEIEKNRIFANSTIFVFPTFLPQETFGLVNLEAMRAGLPVISTDNGAIPEVVIDGKTGYIVPQKDSKKLAEKIIELLENPEKARKMGGAGRKRFEKNYTVEVFEKNMIEVVKKIMSRASL